MWQAVQQILTQSPHVVAVLADLVTVVIGLIAIWGLIFKRRELGFVFRVFANAHLNQRVNRLKETLGKLETLNYDQKEDRSELNALVGQVCGQVKPLVGDYPKLVNVYDELLALVERKKRLSESKKRRLVYELHGILDDTSFHQQHQVLSKNSNER